jgi:hypothetical protein
MSSDNLFVSDGATELCPCTAEVKMAAPSNLEDAGEGSEIGNSRFSSDFECLWVLQLAIKAHEIDTTS